MMRVPMMGDGDDTSDDLLDEYRPGVISSRENDEYIQSGRIRYSPWGTVSSDTSNPFRLLASNPATSARFAAANTDCNPATAGVTVNAETYLSTMLVN